MKELDRNWLDYAKRDLQAAQQLATDAELTGLAAFHSQQCIEKSFKALLEFYDAPASPRLIGYSQGIERHADDGGDSLEVRVE